MVLLIIDTRGKTRALQCSFVHYLDWVYFLSSLTGDRGILPPAITLLIRNTIDAMKRCFLGGPQQEVMMSYDLVSCHDHKNNNKKIIIKTGIGCHGNISH